MNYGPELISLGIEGDADERGNPVSFGTPQLVTQQEIDDVDIISELPPDLLNYPAPPPGRMQPSGVGAPIVELIFEDPDALTEAEKLCALGQLPAEICQVYDIDTP